MINTPLRHGISSPISSYLYGVIGRHFSVQEEEFINSQAKPNIEQVINLRDA